MSADVQSPSSHTGLIKIASRPFATYKTSTGLVGLAVDPNGRETLRKLSDEILEAVKVMPEDAGYRIHVEKWYTYISKTCNEIEEVTNKSVYLVKLSIPASTNFDLRHTFEIRAIEDEIDLGQIEEVILIAQDELGLVDYYNENKGWELVAKEQARADEVVKSMHDSIYFFEEKRPKQNETEVKV